MYSETLPESAVKKVNNLVRDAKLAITVGMIPILGLIYILRLVQWYLLKNQYPVLASSDAAHHAALAKEFRSVLPRFWFAVLMWPGTILFLIVYFAVI